MANASTVSGSGSILFSEYSKVVAETDVLGGEDLRPVLMGLYGEVGGIMSTAKKHVREGAAYPGFRKAAEEEFGDTLWYLAAICRRIGVPLDDVFRAVTVEPSYASVGAASDIASGAVVHVAIPKVTRSLDEALFHLGRAAANLLDATPRRDAVVEFARHYLDALGASELCFSDVVRSNIDKTRSAFIPPAIAELPCFDTDFNAEERLPETFRVRISQRGSGKSYLQWNGVFVGEPLTDNIADGDGYRFHDVFHLAYAAILHWSPVVRALIKQKRKSINYFDEIEDGGRAIVVEEGVTAWIFTRAKELNYFDNQDRISMGLLKIIREFVTGYEVAQCPLKLWERAILEGYAVFRQVRDAQGGWVVGDRNARIIRYEPLETD